MDCSQLPPDYVISQDYSGDYTLTTVDELCQWIDDRSDDYIDFLAASGEPVPDFNTDDIGGLFAVQTSLTYDQAAGEFTQRGTAPNYFGATLTYATCRWMQRGHDAGNGGWNFSKFFVDHPDNDEVLRPKQPTLLIHVASSQPLAGRNRRPVASIAFVTHGFWTVEAYARYLIDNCPEAAITPRLTHDIDSADYEKAVAFGDCHADRFGNVDEPPECHDHHEGTESSCGCSSGLLPHKDTAADHVKCLSLPGFWHAYTGEPAFELHDVGDFGVKYVDGESSLYDHLRPFGVT